MSIGLTDEDLSRWIAERLEPDPWEAAERNDSAYDVARFWQTVERFTLRINIKDISFWQPRDMVNDPAMTVMLMREMKKANMQFSIESDPDFNSAVDINAHAEAIKDHRDYGIQLNWGDSNCSHPKPYDPSDGHGYTSFYLICDSLGRAVAEAFALANGYTD